MDGEGLGRYDSATPIATVNVIENALGGNSFFVSCRQ
jgi:hypothetical protein